MAGYLSTTFQLWNGLSASESGHYEEGTMERVLRRGFYSPLSDGSTIGNVIFNSEVSMSTVEVHHWTVKHN